MEKYLQDNKNCRVLVILNVTKHNFQTILRSSSMLSIIISLEFVLFLSLT